MWIGNSRPITSPAPAKQKQESQQVIVVWSIFCHCPQFKPSETVTSSERIERKLLPRQPSEGVPATKGLSCLSSALPAAARRRNTASTSAQAVASLCSSRALKGSDPNRTGAECTQRHAQACAGRGAARRPAIPAEASRWPTLASPSMLSHMPALAF